MTDKEPSRADLSASTTTPVPAPTGIKQEVREQALCVTADAPAVIGELGAAARAGMLNSVKETPLWKQLVARRMNGEISQEDFDWDQVMNVYAERRPVTRADVGNRAVILTASEVEQFHVFSFVDSTGEEQQIEPESVNDVLILLPEDFGNPV